MGKRSRKGRAPAAEAGGTGPSGVGGFGALLAAKGLVASEPAPAAEGPAEPPTPPAESTWATGGKIVLRYTRKGRGGKAVTLVQGLERADLKPMSKGVSKALGCGSRIESGEVVVQGDQRERLEAWLRGQGFTRLVLS